MPPSRRGGDNVGVSPGPVIALIDGEHHPPAVRDALDRLDAERGVAAVVFCGGEEKVPAAVLAAPEGHYGRAVASGAPAAELVRGAVRAVPDARAVVDLADEPVLDAPAKLRLAAFALHLGLDYEAPGVRLAAPRYERLALAGPVVAVIGTGKRTGKTAVSASLARLLAERGTPPVVSRSCAPRWDATARSTCCSARTSSWSSLQPATSPKRSGWAVPCWMPT